MTGQRFATERWTPARSRCGWPVCTYAESFGATGYRITAADDLLPTLRAALGADGVSVIACPVDYSDNLRLTDRLGELDEAR
ncbi:hypothetical protein A5784_21655 [Mycobacterium sp. 852013-50091_SCH5140682]|nr:hypothetical protein A5784_21655 [Mycobacterium sp. 852013-50091_SCH5140682]